MLPVLIAVVVVAIVVVVVVLARRGAGRASARIESRLAQLEVQRQGKGTFHGLASAGEGQVRRLGTLVLTPDELLFLQFVPEGETSVARSDITSVELTTTYLGRTSERELLVVSFADDQGGWELADAGEWKAALGG